MRRMGLLRRRRAAVAVPLGTDRVLRAVVAVDDECDLGLVEAACALARREHARLEVVVGIARPTMTCWFGPSPVMLAESLEDLSDSLLERAVAAVCPDVCLTYRQVRGSARRHVLETAGEDLGTVVVLHGGTRIAKRARRSCRESALLFVGAPSEPTAVGAGAGAGVDHAAGAPA